MTEKDLTACKATDSSLWEIKTLQSHVLPEIANAAKFIERDLPKLEWDVKQDLETTLEDVSDLNYYCFIDVYYNFSLITVTGERVEA